MSVTATCGCGATYQLKIEFAGKKVKCRNCGSVIDAIAMADVVQEPQADPVFDRDKFLLRQKMFAINQRYTVSDENQQPIVYVFRPTYVMRTMLALVAAILSFLLVGGLVVGAFAAIGQAVASGQSDREAWIAVGVIAGMVLALPACVAVAIGIQPKRHIMFYRDEAYTQKLIDVLQDSKWQIITHTYTLRDIDGNPLARFRKNHLYNLFRRRWMIESMDGSLICRAMEDSMILSLLRRFLGHMYGLLRTNFIILPAGSDEIIGEFNRKLTLFDRYVLDMSADRTRSLDRRIALALGVMLDTGERR